MVAAEDCATQASLDARCMHLIHYAPDGERAAYVHRELRYDREGEEYVPDSSLVLSGPRGENTEPFSATSATSVTSAGRPTGLSLPST